MIDKVSPWRDFAAYCAELRRLVDADERLQNIETSNLIVQLDIGSAGICRISPGRNGAVTTQEAIDDVTIMLGGGDELWESLLAPAPRAARHHHLAMLMREPSWECRGDDALVARHLFEVRRILELAREAAGGGCRPVEDGAWAADVGEIEAILGRYVHVAVNDVRYRVFVEEAGTGPTLLLLHTAGADSRQFHHLMDDAELKERWRMVAFDLPWHGRSLPVGEAKPGSWRLTTNLYASIVESIIDVLQLDRPVVLGASMAGLICLELAWRFPDRLRGVIACEASDHVEGRRTDWVLRRDVDQSQLVPEWIYGLLSPISPEPYAFETWWIYSQGGYRTFAGDINFYSGEWDARDRVASIDTERCPVFMLTGEYDYSCTTDMSAATAAKIPGARFSIMPGLGHFPISENPRVFLNHLRPILDVLASR